MEPAEGPVRWQDPGEPRHIGWISLPDTGARMSDRSIQERMFEELTDKRVFEQAKAFAFDYMDCVAERSVFPEQGAIDGLRVFDETMPKDPSPSGEVIAALHDFGSPATVAQTGGRYFGFGNFR